MAKDARMKIDSYGYDTERKMYVPLVDADYIQDAVKAMLRTRSEQEMLELIRDVYQRGYRTAEALRYIGKISDEGKYKTVKERATALRNYLMIGGWSPDHVRKLVTELKRDEMI
jgi:hypothetical protein